jgi:hypothetical protein
VERTLSRLSRFPATYLEEIYQHSVILNNVVNGKQWLNRFDELALAIESGVCSYRQIEDHIFELKVISYLSTLPDWDEIQYQPLGADKNGKNCDLSVKTRSQAFLFELKTFHPEDKSAKIPRQHISKNNELTMDPVLFHHYQAVRGHLLDVTIQVEEKMENYSSEQTKIMGVYIGFHLHLDTLQDFVAIYRTGQPRADDPLGDMTIYELQKKNYVFKGSINSFWAFPFEQCSFSLRNNERVVSIP